MEADLVRWLTSQGIGVIIALVVLLRLDARMVELSRDVRSLCDALREYMIAPPRAP